MYGVTLHVHYTCFSEGNHTFSPKESGLHDKEANTKLNNRAHCKCLRSVNGKQTRTQKQKQLPTAEVSICPTKPGVEVSKYHAVGIHSLPIPLLCSGCLLVCGCVTHQQ